MKKLLFILFLFALGVFTSCAPAHHHKNGKVEIKTYTQVRTADDDLLFWYIIMINDNSYYSYSSTTQITDYKSISWTASTTNPVSNLSGKVQEVETEEISENELAAEVEEAVEAESANDVATDEVGSDGNDVSDDAGDVSDGGGFDGGDGGGDGGGGE